MAERRVIRRRRADAPRVSDDPPLDQTYRAAALEALGRTEFDVLVVGGGVVGAGTALDAATRGLSVALVEARDLAAGTSGRSSKLIHGGLRYLEQRDFALVREALRERGLLLRRLAPHLVRPVPFLFPLRHRIWERAYIGAGVALYDALGGARHLPRHRHLSRRQTLRLAPALRPDSLVGGIRYYDGQVDDARYTMMLARTAARYGATVLTRTEVTGLRYDGPRVVGARARDLESGREVVVDARRVVSATGVWTDDLLAAASAAEADRRPTEAGPRTPFRIRMSKGVHLLVPRDRLPLATGLITRTEKSVLLVIPWGRHWIVGTTDTDYSLDKARPAADRSDVSYLLERVNAWLCQPLTRADIHGVYAGLRPLLSGESDEVAQLSREHAVAEAAPGLFVVAGGKYTTYRVMAADVVDAVTNGLGRTVSPSTTEDVPVVGAVGYHDLWDDRDRLASEAGLPVATMERLLGRYGAAVTDLVELINDVPGLADPIPGAAAYLKVEAVYAISHEGALHLDDVLSRRTRISIETPDRGLAAAPEVARLIGARLGWDEATRRDEVTRYRQVTEAEQRARDAIDGGAVTRARGAPAAW